MNEEYQIENDNTVREQECSKILYLLHNQKDSSEPDYIFIRNVFTRIQKEFHFSSVHFWMYKAFQYGIMIGKNVERARKRG